MAKEGRHNGRRGPNKAARANPWLLTNAEMRIVAAICAGEDAYKGIAKALGVGTRTVQTQLSKIRVKMGVEAKAGIIHKVLSDPVARERCFPHLLIADRVLNEGGEDDRT